MILRTPRRAAIALTALAALAIGGCASIKDHKGYIVDSTLIDTVQPGIDNRDSVAKTLGRPTFVAQYDPNLWYYLSRNTRQSPLGVPKASEQVLLKVRFDGQGNVAAVERSGLEQIASIDPVSDKTPTLGRDRGFFSELFGNIGRVGATGTGAGTADNPTGN